MAVAKDKVAALAVHDCTSQKYIAPRHISVPFLIYAIQTNLPILLKLIFEELLIIRYGLCILFENRLSGVILT